MSSTNRGAEKSPNEYYYTRPSTIQEFWRKFCEVENKTIQNFLCILDPFAGGDEKRSCAYPEALKIFDPADDDQIKESRFFTIDIRENSKAIYKQDYFSMNVGMFPLIMSNPPFTLFESAVIKSLNEVFENGYVIYLCRINIAGGQKRKTQFWDKLKPKAIYVHSKRPFPDSCEYGHFVFQRGWEGKTEFIWI